MKSELKIEDLIISSKHTGIMRIVKLEIDRENKVQREYYLDEDNKLLKFEFPLETE